jgi:hypothetical protein
VNQRLCVTVALFLSRGVHVAGELRGIAFFHKDRERACDNTRTRRFIAMSY